MVRCPLAGCYGFEFCSKAHKNATATKCSIFRSPLRLTPPSVGGGNPLVTSHPFDVFGVSTAMSLASRLAPLPLRNLRYASVMDGANVGKQQDETDYYLRQTRR